MLFVVTAILDPSWVNADVENGAVGASLLGRGANFSSTHASLCLTNDLAVNRLGAGGHDHSPAANGADSVLAVYEAGTGKHRKARAGRDELPLISAC